MGVRIYTNIDAIDADRHLGITSTNLSKAIQRLSSGLRINSAADDAAGLAISERLRAQVAGDNQAVRNSQDGISLFQTAEGALDEVHAMLQRARELTVQAANGTLSSNDVNSIGAELQQLGNAIDRIAHTTQFNGLILLDGTFNGSVPGGVTNPLTLQVGANGNTFVAATGITYDYTLQVTMNNMTTESLADSTGTVIGLDQILGSGTWTAANIVIAGGGGLQTVSVANQNLLSLDLAIDAVSSFRGQLGAKQNALEHTINSLNVASENQAAAESRIRDLDVANQTVEFTKLQILQQAGTAVLAQANTSPQTVLQLLR
ncbi:MAG TPA: flagellin [Chloroflexota bacterium]|nr:flagellin [Chloroflexota bacterium]